MFSCLLPGVAKDGKKMNCAQNMRIGRLQG